MSYLVLPIIFALTALVYAMVGFGGGSTYAALLSLSDLDYTRVPVLVLVCNIVVVAGGVLHFWRARLLDFKAAWPLVMTSIPLAWFGGRIPIAREYFLLLLGISLFVSGVLLIVQKSQRPENDAEAGMQWPDNWRLFAPVIGGSLGFLAGLVGIGGGIFLAPLLHHLRVAKAKSIAALACFFILVNSIAGLAGQVTKHGVLSLHPSEYGVYIWLPVAVFIGGQVGSRISVTLLSGAWVRKITGVLIVFVSVRLLFISYLSF